MPLREARGHASTTDTGLVSKLRSPINFSPEAALLSQLTSLVNYKYLVNYNTQMPLREAWSATSVFGYHFDMAKKRILTQDGIDRYMNNSDELSELSENGLE
ncbi:hypothetical protein TNCV_4122641 [Trichonephila clavipes]|nr:hypothetical protein TNCV_4122641 [Trichonephila clavipes]